jgi:hypothetical protein
MTLGFEVVQNKVVSYALSSGLFEQVNLHEPKSSPGTGLTCAIWIQSISPINSASGLASTSGRILFMIRLYQNMLMEPQDAIDPELVNAVDVLMGTFSGDFDLGSTVKNIDLLGQYGVALNAISGFTTVDGKMFRVFDIFLPVIINDIWQQSS